MTETRKKILLLFDKKTVETQRAYPADLTKLLNDADPEIEVSSVLFNELLFSLDGSSVDVVDTVHNRSLTEYDSIYFRYWDNAKGPALTAARFCKLKGIPFVDSEVLLYPGSFNKISQYMNLYEAGVPFPKTLIAPGEQLLSQYAAYGFHFPFVLKSSTGTRGRDNYVVHNKTEMRTVLENNPELTFVLQEFVPNAGDYRVLVMGDKVVMVIKRTATEGTHLNNVSQGGSAEIVPVESLPREVLDLSVRAAHYYGRQVAGVDMVQSADDGSWYCFEVNRSPQIEHASFEREKAALLAQYLRTLASSTTQGATIP